MPLPNASKSWLAAAMTALALVVAAPSFGDDAAAPAAATPAPVKKTIGTEFFVGSRANPGDFINVQKTGLSVSPILVESPGARWSLEPVPESQYFRMRNLVGDGQYLNLQSGSLAVGAVEDSSELAMWQLAPQGPGYFLIVNVGKPDLALIDRRGQLVAATIGHDWLAAQWWLLH